MDRDYVNKQIVCPDCGKKDVLYIDLNEIKMDPQFSTGIVVRSHLHDDHLLLLDIDGNGDVRSIHTISRIKEILPNSNSFGFFEPYLANDKTILVFSSKQEAIIELQTLIQKYTKTSQEFKIINHPNIKILSFDSRELILIQDEVLLKNIDNPNVIILDSFDDYIIYNNEFANLIKNTEEVLCTSSDIIDLLTSVYTGLRIKLVES